jgi:hypothetical protein
MPGKQKKKPLPLCRRPARNGAERAKTSDDTVFIYRPSQKPPRQGTRLSRDDKKSQCKPGAPGICSQAMIVFLDREQILNSPAHTWLIKSL